MIGKIGRVVGKPYLFASRPSVVLKNDFMRAESFFYDIVAQLETDRGDLEIIS